MAILLVAAFGARMNPGIIGHAVMGLSSRIGRHGLLGHLVRLRVHACILERPGITVQGIAKAHAIGWGRLSTLWADPSKEDWP